MNPYGNLSNKNNIKLILLVIYNLPPWFCMKCKYVMLLLLILGPNQPSNDINIFLVLLIDDLRLMWDKGMTMFDTHH